MSERIEFEDDAPIELRDVGELEEVSQTEISQESGEIDKALKKNAMKKERDAKIKQKPPALNLHVRPENLKKQKPKDYIVVRCNICEHDFQHAKKDDNGALMPYALCQHIVFKGVVLEE